MAPASASTAALAVSAAAAGAHEGSKPPAAPAPAAPAAPTPPRYIAKHPFVAGALTGGIEILITFPFEFIKVQLQLKHHYQQKNAFSNPVDCALYTLRTKGPLGLYKGLTPWIVFAFPRSAVRFSTYELAAQRLQGDAGKVDPLYAMLAGTLAGSIEFATVGTPMQCIQIKMAHDAYSGTPKFKGFLDAVAGIVREEGLWRGLYAGVGPTVLKGGVNNCIRFSAFNEMKHLYQEYKNGKEGGGGTGATDGPALNAAESMLLGAVAGGLSAVATHPIDTVKSNMQALGGGGYPSSWACLTAILRTQGLRGLYRGMAPRFVRVCLEIALHFTLYERIARELDKLW